MHIQNPILWSDYPDPDLIRVGDTYYMVTTTMFFMPGGPIMKSRDLIHWEIVSYIFDKMEGYDEVGAGYGRGQWATSLRAHNGMYYAFFTCLDRGKSYLYYTDDIERSFWEHIEFDMPYHDASLLFDENDCYLIYNCGDVRIARFSPDMHALTEDAPLFSTAKEGMALRCEGCRALKKDGYYYLFFIDIPAGGIRRELCYRSREIYGPYEMRVIANSMCAEHNRGVAQGMPVDTPEGDWYMILFGDHGAVGRIPYLFPVSWEDGWPVVGAGDGMCLSYETPMQECGKNILVRSDSFQHTENRLGLYWQWNHNPDDKAWSFTQRPGWLRLHAAPAAELMRARNTLSQRTCGPGCTFTVELDAAALAPGARAGLAALQYDCSMIGVEIGANGRMRIFTARRDAVRMGEAGPEYELTSAPVPAGPVFLRAQFDFRDRHDTVRFAYSTDGINWVKQGEAVPLHFNLRYFVGTRAALYCYGQGYADFRSFTAEAEE